MSTDNNNTNSDTNNVAESSVNITETPTTSAQQAPKRAVSPSNTNSESQPKKVRSKAPSKSTEIGEYIIDGPLRRVKPYDYTYSTYAKGRWLNRGVLEVFQSEFLDQSSEYYASCIESGKITVNDKVVPADFKLKNGNVVKHKIHRHEPPVKSEELDIVLLTDDLVVVDKPCSIPVHPSGRYHFNTLKHILEQDHDINQFYAINRLDRLTSGIVLIARSSKHAHKMEKLMKSRQIQKFYLTQVRGKFHNYTKCCEPIKTVNYKLGLNEVLPEGKESETHFKLINYNEKEDLSLVLCKPLTGRTHQIRVHLQHLGFPIINDPLYNSTYKAELEVKKQSLPATIGTCEVCKWDILRDPEDYELDLNLHAFEYRVSGEVYRSKKLPKWVGGLVSVDDVIEIKFDSDNEDAKENGDEVKEAEAVEGKEDSKVDNEQVEKN